MPVYKPSLKMVSRLPSFRRQLKLHCWPSGPRAPRPRLAHLEQLNRRRGNPYWGNCTEVKASSFGSFMNSPCDCPCPALWPEKSCVSFIPEKVDMNHAGIPYTRAGEPCDLRQSWWPHWQPFLMGWQADQARGRKECLLLALSPSKAKFTAS